MRPKSLILLMLALGCGLVASIGINQVMANRRGASGHPGETTPIFVAMAEIGLGEYLTPEVLKLEEWPKEKVPAGALAKLDDVKARRTRTKFYPGEPILEQKLFGPGESGGTADGMIPQGFRVVPVRVDAVSGVAGLILPGDRVDVLVHMQENKARGISRTTTRTFVQNIKVFAVDDVFSREKDGDSAIAAKTISLLVTPTQAELVTSAQSIGEIRLVMRSANDDSVADTTGVTPDDLLHKLAAVTPDPAPKPHPNLLDLLQPKRNDDPESTAGPQPFEWQMLLLSGETANLVQFHKGELLPVTASQAATPDAPAKAPAAVPQPAPPSAEEEESATAEAEESK